MAVTLTDMLLIHDVFRREFASLPALIRRVEQADLDRSVLIADHLAALTAGVHIHHESEDEFIWPRLHERGAPEVATLEEMASEHDRLTDGVRRIEELTDRWRHTADREVAESLANELESVEVFMNAHLDHEEADAFPLMNRYLSQQEWEEMGEEGWKRTAPDQVMIFMGQMAEDAREPAWTDFLGRLPPPLVAAYQAEGAPAYAHYVQKLRGEPARAARQGNNSRDGD